MKQISLKKMELTEIEVMQNELLKFINHKTSTMNYCSDDFINSLLLIDISQSLFFDFRNRIEKSSKSLATINIRASEAAVLISCCQFDKTNRGEYQAFVMQKFSDLLHEKLVNL